MSDQVKVALEALGAYAKAAAEISRGFDQARQPLVDADVTSDSFGLLAESHDIHKAYADQCDTGLAALTAGRDVFADLAEVFLSMRESYRAADEESAREIGGR
jgi:hypothetical protein